MPALSSHPLPHEAVSERARSFRVTPITSEAAPKSRPRPRAPLLAGRYAIDRYLDKGGTSKVYLGWDELCEEEVVIKILTDDAARCNVLRGHFLVGSRAALSVKHENVVKTLAVRDPDPGTPYMVMEMLRGELAADLLARKSQISSRVTLLLAAQTAAGLSALHDSGIIHCDIKPDNLFLTRNEDTSSCVKILDFGLAEVEGKSATSEVHAVRGTAQFMAPEQVLGDPVDARTDVYALGVVMFRMLTGQLPFDLKLSATLLRHQLFSPTPPLSWLCDDLEPAIEAIVLKAMRKNPVNRYISALELATDLQLVVDGYDPKSSFELRAADVYTPQSSLGERAAALLGAR
ncbi:MAG: serine/threonine-protein kinase [Polyangiaceae bacterium]